MSKPTEGGSYVRRKDKTLERVAFTQPAGSAPAAPATTEPPPPASHLQDGKAAARGQQRGARKES